MTLRCDPCRQDQDGNTALIACCYENNLVLSNRQNKISIVKMLLKHKSCGIALCNHMGKSALQYACTHALVENVELLPTHKRL